MSKSYKLIEKLMSLGWSQDNIAKAVGVTRPTIKLIEIGGEPKLNIETYEKLKALCDLNISQKEFLDNAFNFYTYEFVWKTAYKSLAYREVK